MPIKYLKGDLFSTPLKFIAHGCNARGVMGKGVAKLVRDKYPKAFNDYKVSLDSLSPYPGDIIRSIQGDGKVILNLITQKDYAKTIVNTHRFVSYDAISIAFSRMEMYYHDVKEHGLAIPKIGAGLGGGNWRIIESIILASAPSINITVYEEDICDSIILESNICDDLNLTPEQRKLKEHLGV